MTSGGPRKLEPRFVERVWGRHSLAPWFGVYDQPIGEVWFCPGADSPLLVKFIFTAAKLSVQVHPDDAYAALHENSRGKTEMWHVLEADPGAEIAIGFRQEVGLAALKQAIADGTVESLLNWVPATAGDTFFVKAGVVHAIGAGITLCEIQQNSDITYRIFDYGRPRELHLEKGLAVCDPGVYDARRSMPVECRHFRTEAVEVRDPIRLEQDGETMLIVLSGRGRIEEQVFGPGEVWWLGAGTRPRIQADGAARFLRTSWACAPASAGQ